MKPTNRKRRAERLGAPERPAESPLKARKNSSLYRMARNTYEMGVEWLANAADPHQTAKRLEREAAVRLLAYMYGRPISTVAKNVVALRNKLADNAATAAPPPGEPGDERKDDDDSDE